MDTTLSSPTTPVAVKYQVAAYAALRATSEEIAAYRRQPPPIHGQPLPASLLKHSDDQTVAALVAVHEANTRQGWIGRSFSDWGVVAAANFFGRGGTAASIQRFGQEGAWGVSPHIIPHQSLHAVSGTISQLLKIHGPNFGINGGPEACHDAFLIAGAILAEETVPGLWLLLSGHEREWLPIENGKTADPARSPRCGVVALALMQSAEAQEGMRLRIGPHANQVGLGEFSLSALIDVLTTENSLPSGAWRMPGAGWFELGGVDLRVESRR